MPMRFVVLFASLLASGLALPQVPGGLLPGEIEKQFQKPPEPRARPGDIRIPLQRQAVPPNADAVKFGLKAVAIEGVTVYSEAALRPYYATYLDREVSLADIYDVAAALTARYRNDGYILSQVLVPAQAVNEGRVRLQAVEGYLAEVKVQAEKDPRPPLVMTYADKLKAVRPLTAEALERYLLLINDLPGALARTTLVPSASERGASDLLIQFSQRRASGGLNVDNRGSSALGPVLFGADAEVNALFSGGDRTAARGATTFSNELHYLYAVHDEQVGSEGAKISIAISFVRSKPDQDAFIPLALRGDSNSGTVFLSYPQIRGRNENLYLRAGFSAYNGSEKLFGVTEVNDRIRALRFGFTYDLADRYGGIDIVDVELGQGLNALGASAPGDLEVSRINAKPSFTKISLYAARTNALAEKWSLLTAVTGQYAWSDLLAPELFCYGGEQFGRAYDPCAFSGDYGAALKQELRYSDIFLSHEYTAYGFYDLGYVRQRSPGGLEASAHGASVGIGCRVTLAAGFTGFVELAKQLATAPASDSKTLRVYGGASWRF